MEKIDKLLKRGRRAFRRRGVRRLLFYAKKLTGYASTSAPRRTWMWTGTRSRPLSGIARPGLRILYRRRRYCPSGASLGGPTRDKM